MNKKDLTRLLADRLSITAKESNRYTTVLLELITEELENNGTLVLQGFGTLVPWKQTERPGRNPRTGKTCLIHPRTSVKFRPGKHLLKALNREH